MRPRCAVWRRRCSCAPSPCGSWPRTLVLLQTSPGPGAADVTHRAPHQPLPRALLHPLPAFRRDGHRRPWGGARAGGAGSHPGRAAPPGDPDHPPPPGPHRGGGAGAGRDGRPRLRPRGRCRRRPGRTTRSGAPLRGGRGAGGQPFQVHTLHTPGHTPGSATFVLRRGEDVAAFCGDTLFAGSAGNPRAGYQASSTPCASSWAGYPQGRSSIPGTGRPPPWPTSGSAIPSRRGPRGPDAALQVDPRRAVVRRARGSARTSQRACASS